MGRWGHEDMIVREYGDIRTERHVIDTNVLFTINYNSYYCKNVKILTRDRVFQSHRFPKGTPGVNSEDWVNGLNVDLAGLSIA